MWSLECGTSPPNQIGPFLHVFALLEVELNLEGGSIPLGGSNRLDEAWWVSFPKFWARPRLTRLGPIESVPSSLAGVKHRGRCGQMKKPQ